jgi:hypothetical protein
LIPALERAGTDDNPFVSGMAKQILPKLRPAQ